jgi:hypothetical protein
MMLFDDAYALIGAETEITVTRDEPEPPKGSPAWRHWRHNHLRGRIVEKMAGPPRVIRVELPEEEIAPGVTSRPIYDIVEGMGHYFEEAEAPDLEKMSSQQRGRRDRAHERGRQHRMKPEEIIAEVETRVVAALEALFPDIKGKLSLDKRKELFPNAR